MSLKLEDFHQEVAAAVRNYEKFVVCIDKTPDEFVKAVSSLLEKAIKTYETRAPGLRHGIALDRHVTIILSDAEAARPFCGIYFNLHSPYRKKSA